MKLSAFHTFAIVVLSLLMLASFWSFGGSMRTSSYSNVGGANVGNSVPSNVTAYILITITNQENIGISSGFQQLLKMDWRNYSSHLRSDVANVEFFNGSWTAMYAWCESNCTSSSANGRVWVKLNEPIARSGAITIYMAFYNKSTDNFNAKGHWGEYPTATSTYGKFDNGKLVFSFYDNFAGTKLDKNWLAILFGSGESYSVDNGLTITTTSSPQAVHIVSTKKYNPSNYTFDSDLSSYQICDCGNAWDVVKPTTGSGDRGWQTDYRFENNNGESTRIVVDVKGQFTDLYNGKYETGGIYSALWLHTGSEKMLVNYATSAKTTDREIPITNSYIELYNTYGGSSTITFQWARLRVTPPGNEMPKVSFGSVIKVHGTDNAALLEGPAMSVMGRCKDCY